MEHDRAHKKINETSRKADMLEKLKAENDAKFISQLEAKERREREKMQTANGMTFAEVRRQ